jgi:hypothetical protein
MGKADLFSLAISKLRYNCILAVLFRMYIFMYALSTRTHKQTSIMLNDLFDSWSVYVLIQLPGSITIKIVSRNSNSILLTSVVS